MMNQNLKICIKVDDNIVYEFSGSIDNLLMIETANDIERLLLRKALNREKVKRIFELFIETAQNIVNYAYADMNLYKKYQAKFCNFSLYYFTSTDTFVLESCNLIDESKRKIIESKLERIKGLDQKELRKLVRQKSRSQEDKHENGAGLGYIMMARKSSAPIEVKFLPYKAGILIYKQKLFI